MGLINTVYSYVDTIAISFTCDRDMMPDPHVYADALKSALEALRASTAPPPTPVRTRKTNAGGKA